MTVGERIRRPAAVEAACVLALGGFIALAIFIAIRAANGGAFTYSLDDAAIHLALSEGIARGHYGLNPGEVSSPSSSILWPFLLAPLAGSSLHRFVPLAINLTCLMMSLGVLLAIVRRVIQVSVPAYRAHRVVVTLALALGLNLFGLAFTGMEHSLQVLLTLLVALGSIVLIEEDRAPWWLLAGIALGPLVRYENAAISLAAIGMLASRRKFGAAAGLAGFLLAAVGGFSLFLKSLGLDALPSSVLLKTAIAEYETVGRGPLAAMWMTARYAATHEPAARLLQLLTLLALMLAFLNWVERRARPLAWVAVFALGAHMLAGRYGWFGRYEIYVLAFAFALLMYVARGFIAGLYETFPPAVGATFLPAAILLLLLPYIGVTLATPRGANNIFEQQVQMRRFVTEHYRDDVAANDIGWLTYRNENAVLDLWGLGSKTLGQMRLTNEPGWLEREVGAREIGLLIVYESWYAGQIPEGWSRAARLYLSGAPTTVAEGAVTFIVTPWGAEAEIRNSLAAFKETLPEGVRLEIAPRAEPAGL